ncbi:hypothetical protein NC653_034675 [Populus alba x Populus x berolinensis]|uniref:Uncharacterized protein n=1 Tax=Populus alba x Populus x berolinensis TaxID=444605 RepID=A0AAD6LN68_9ROSI|nr:hypothetical protein NC653_034675 [Populus alba x Populus x berolinensis]
MVTLSITPSESETHESKLRSSHLVNRTSNSSESRPSAQRCSRTISLGREPHPHPNGFLPSGQRAAEGSHQQLPLVLDCDIKSARKPAANHLSNLANSIESRPSAQHCSKVISLGREPHPHPNEFLPSGQRAAEGLLPSSTAVEERQEPTSSTHQLITTLPGEAQLHEAAPNQPLGPYHPSGEQCLQPALPAASRIIQPASRRAANPAAYSSNNRLAPKNQQGTKHPSRQTPPTTCTSNNKQQPATRRAANPAAYSSSRRASTHGEDHTKKEHIKLRKAAIGVPPREVKIIITSSSSTKEVIQGHVQPPSIVKRIIPKSFQQEHGNLRDNDPSDPSHKGYQRPIQQRQNRSKTNNSQKRARQATSSRQLTPRSTKAKLHEGRASQRISPPIYQFGETELRRRGGGDALSHLLASAENPEARWSKTHLISTIEAEESIEAAPGMNSSSSQETVDPSIIPTTEMSGRVGKRLRCEEFGRGTGPRQFRRKDDKTETPSVLASHGFCSVESKGGDTKIAVYRDPHKWVTKKETAIGNYGAAAH